MAESLEIQALQARALELWEVDKTSALELGRALIAVRDAMPAHGDFTKWWRAHDLDENRVYYCIRKAEGKEKSTQPQAQGFLLNRRSLAVARVATTATAKYNVPVLHVGPAGTTATDGYLMVRTSLPPNMPQPSGEGGLLPRDLALRLMAEAGNGFDGSGRGGPVEVHLGKKGITATGADGITISSPPPDQQQFPAIDSFLNDLGKHAVWCKGNMNLAMLKKLVESAEAFGSDRVEITITDAHIRFDAEHVVDAGRVQKYCGMFGHALKTPADKAGA